ncbi:unnamed protein product, partial [Oikopleura dioica]
AVSSFGRRALALRFHAIDISARPSCTDYRVFKLF